MRLLEASKAGDTAQLRLMLAQGYLPGEDRDGVGGALFLLLLPGRERDGCRCPMLQLYSRIQTDTVAVCASLRSSGPQRRPFGVRTLI